MSYRKTQKEIYAVASVASNFSPAVRDTMTAAGMLGSKHAAVTTLWRLLYSLDHYDYKDAIEALTRLLLRKKIDYAVARNVARVYVRHAICPVCPTCQGRKQSLIGDAKGGRGTLDDAPCQTCGGTGERDFRAEAKRELGEDADHALWLQGEISSLDAYAEHDMHWKMRGV